MVGRVGASSVDFVILELCRGRGKWLVDGWVFGGDCLVYILEGRVR